MLRDNRIAVAAVEFLAVHSAIGGLSSWTLSLPLPEQLTYRLVIKNGDALMPCRNKAPPVDFVFRVADGWRVLMAMVQERFESKLPGQWSTDFAVMLKGSKGSAQNEFVRLCQGPEAFRAQLQTVWHTARLTSEGQAGFVLMLFVYVPKAEQPITMRRPTATRIKEQMPRVASHLQQHGVPTGGGTHTHHTACARHFGRLGRLAFHPPDQDMADMDHLDE
ncbi:hypothetical protein BBJ28_00024516 [Nothophytophthora sp. Chile5]|nr:hypothetical protein BBJ28_00024516 [Nothophytophthora sp. Chile5]